MRSAGIHHITAMAGDPQLNLDFYTETLGLRLVKRTVNFDDPTTYHFYFGDESGNPGSILTFFPWPEARRGRQGGGQVAVTSFSILPSSVGFWIERLIKKRVEFEQPAARCGRAEGLGLAAGVGGRRQDPPHRSAAARARSTLDDRP